MNLRCLPVFGAIPISAYDSARRPFLYNGENPRIAFPLARVCVSTRPCRPGRVNLKREAAVVTNDKGTGVPLTRGGSEREGMSGTILVRTRGALMLSMLYFFSDAFWRRPLDDRT